MRNAEWAAGLAGATIIALLVATQNFVILQRAGSSIEWWALALGELPVWYAWLAMFPAVRFLALRFPPVGARSIRHVALHIGAAAVATVLMIAAATAVRIWIPGMVPPQLDYLEAVRRGSLGSFVLFLPIYGILVMGVLAVNYYRDTQERAMKESRLQAALVSARLDSLRDQLHPHFLFNTLHAVSALMAEDVPAARRMMRRLSELLRVTLEEGPHEVTLEDEIGILEMYVGIQKIRFGDRLAVDYRIQPEAKTVLVPRLLLQPLVENAIKHGTGTHGRQGRITVAGDLADGRLVLSVADNGPGFPVGAGPRSHGIGLSNTAARLEHLYGDHFSLELRNSDEGGAMIVITVPVRPALPPKETP